MRLERNSEGQIPFPKPIISAEQAAYKKHIVPLIMQLVKRIDSKPRPYMLYHYTDEAGLRGIISSGVLWASSAAYCNDRSEYQYGLDLCHQAIESIQTFTSITHQRVVQAVDNALTGHNNLAIYITSLSLNGDLLSQWRGYADDGRGFSLGFDNLIETKIRKAGITADGIAVSYEPDFQKKWFEVIIRNYAGDIVNSVGPELAEQYWEYIEMLVEREVATASVGFKHQGFAEEVEYRLAVRPSIAGDLNATVQTRLLHGTPVQYIELRSQGCIPLQQVIVGPNSDFEKERKNITNLLQEYGYDLRRISIDKSCIPYGKNF